MNCVNIKVKMASGGSRPDRSAVGICGKYSVFFFNFVFVTLGLAVMSLGIWSYTQDGEKPNIVTVLDFFLYVPVVLLLVGPVMACIAFCGCCGALRENTILITIYRIVLLIFILVQLIAVIFVFVLAYQPQVLTQINMYPEDALNEAIEKYRDDEGKRELIDTLQERIGCCGVSNDDEGYKDWNNNLYFNCSGDTRTLEGEECAVPWSCCIRKAGDKINLLCGGQALLKSKEELNGIVYTTGCLKAAADWIKVNIFLFAGIILGLFLPQIVALRLSGNLKEEIKYQKLQWDRR